MTRLEKKRVLLRAAKLVDSKLTECTCVAIELSADEPMSGLSLLRNEYASFWDAPRRSYWLRAIDVNCLLGQELLCDDELRNLRVLMLLLFREAGV